MKILLFFLASIVFLMGLFVGGESLRLCIQVAAGEMSLIGLFAVLPTAALSFIFLFIGVRFWLAKDVKSARNVSGATGVIIWISLSLLLMPAIQLDGIFSIAEIIVPILTGILAYHLLLIGIRRSFKVAEAELGDARNGGKPAGAERTP